MIETWKAVPGWEGMYEVNCVGLGCMRATAHTSYARHRATEFPARNQSFLLIRKGYFYSLTKNGTDWEELLGLDLYTILKQGEQS